MILTIIHNVFFRPLTIMAKKTALKSTTSLAAVLLTGAVAILAAPLPAFAADAGEDDLSMNLLLEPEQGRDYSYRDDHRDKTIYVMLYGLKDPGPVNDGPILKDKKALNAFFKQHWENIRRDYLSNTPDQGMQFMAGDESFASKQLNRNMEGEAAKMVGATLPIGKVTVGGGYTWGEKNPAIMLQTTEGFFAGVSYDTGTTGFQISYLTSGQEVAGLEVGGTDIDYSSILVGTSFRVNDRMGITATAQYRRDDDPLTTGETQAVFTIGTKWKF